MAPDPEETLLSIQAHFHRLILSRATEVTDTDGMKLPELAPLLTAKEPTAWFAVPGMYGGFSYRLEGEGIRVKLISESWSRVVEGSGQRHEVTAHGSKLLDEGFV